MNKSIKNKENSITKRELREQHLKQIADAAQNENKDADE